MVLQMALNYIHTACPDSFVEAVVYGDIMRGTDGSVIGQSIYDVSSLVYVNSVVSRLSVFKPEDPLAFVNGMLDM